MTCEQVCSRIQEVGIVPAIRVASLDDAFFAAETVINSGIPIVEVTMTVPGALDVVSSLRKRHPEAVIGAGTLLTAGQVHACVEAGAMFVTSPGFDPGIVSATKKENVAAIPGSLTPSEVMASLAVGADMVKIFPCARVGGPAYIKSLRAPFPHVPLIASGGVNQLTAVQFIEAGATALGIREDLIPHAAIVSRKADWIHELVRRFLGMVQKARAAQV